MELYPVRIRPEAEAELAKAYRWYEEQRPKLGVQFLREADSCVTGIRRNPEAYPRILKNLRRAVLRRFPYSLFYLVHDKQIMILAIFHIGSEKLKLLVF